MGRLAILGGPRTVTVPPPHFRWPLIGPDEEAAVVGQLRSGRLSYSEPAGVVAEFEEAFAACHGLPYAISTSSGTAALHAAYFALDLEPGDEVLAPAYTHLSTVMPMLHAQLAPVLCDVDPESGNLDLGDAASRISPRTRAIVVTHEYGRVCEMEEVLELARRHDLRVIEDCSHAHGATYHGRPAGTFGDVACFSLQSDKVVPVGEGGILLTRDPALFERAAMLGHFRRRTRVTTDRYAPFVETGYGLKNRLHPLAAALGLVQLRRLPARIEQRRANLTHFDAAVAGVAGVRPLATPSGLSRGGFFRYLLHYDAEELAGLPVELYLDALLAEGVAEVRAGSLVKPLHLTAIFQTLDDGFTRGGSPRRRVYAPGDFPCAERFAASTIQFPPFTEPSGELIDAYCEAMAKVAAEADELVAAGCATTS